MTLVRPTKKTTAIFGTTTPTGLLTTAYDSYVRYCRLIGQAPQKPAEWHETQSKAGANMHGQAIIWNVR